MFSHLYTSTTTTTTPPNNNDSSIYHHQQFFPHNVDNLFLTDEDVLLMAETFNGGDDDSNSSFSSTSSSGRSSTSSNGDNSTTSIHTGNSPNSSPSLSPQNIITQAYQPPTPMVPPMFNFQLQQQNFLSVIQQKQQQQQVPPSVVENKADKVEDDKPNPRKRSRKEIESDKNELDLLLEIPEKERTENQKKLILKLRNRQTAKRSRDRKKQEFETTMEENRKLSVINKQLVEEIKQLKTENQQLKITIEQMNARHTSSEAYLSLTVTSEEPHVEREPDIDSFLANDYRSNTSAMSYQFSPLFNFSNDPSPQKKSKMYMLVFFVAAVCCFFLGTTLVNEIPANALMHKGKVHNDHMIHLNTVSAPEQKIKMGMFSGPGHGFDAMIPLRESVPNVQRRQEEVFDAEVLLPSSRMMPTSSEKKTLKALPFEVQVNPNINDFVQEQFKDSEVPVLLKVHIGTQPAYIFTSLSASLSEDDQTKLISRFQQTVTHHFQLMCKISQ